MSDDGAAALDPPLPPSLRVGRGALLPLHVRLWSPRVRAVAVHVDDEEQRFAVHGRLRRDRDRRRSYVELLLPVRIAGHRAGTTARVRVELIGDGARVTIADGAIAILGPAPPPPPLETPIAICLATHDPDPELLSRQIDSLRAQTRRDWTCLVYDDASTPRHRAELGRILDGDRRFRLHHHATNRGFYRNFEAALSQVPPSTPFVALCDQDDCWHPEKLAESVARLQESPRAQLVYCDMRLVDRAGRLLSPTFWSGRRNNFRSFDTLLVANTVTGAASLFRGALLDLALPFPPAIGTTYHDHWLALVAFVAGGLEYLDRPLYDYTQHESNVIGHEGFTPPTLSATLRRHAANLLHLPSLPQKLRGALDAYHTQYRRLMLFAETLRLRFPSLPPGIERALSLFDDSWPRALELMLPLHLEILRRGETTDMAEVMLGLGLLINRVAEAPLARLATRIPPAPRRSSRRGPAGRP